MSRPSHPAPTRIRFGPTTTAGRGSILAATAFVGFVAVFTLSVAAGQRGGDEFFDNLWLALLGLSAFAAAVCTLVLGVAAITRFGERSLTVGLTTLGGLAVTAFGVLEVVFPH